MFAFVLWSCRWYCKLLASSTSPFFFVLFFLFFFVLRQRFSPQHLSTRVCLISEKSVERTLLWNTLNCDLKIKGLSEIVWDFGHLFIRGFSSWSHDKLRLLYHSMDAKQLQRKNKQRSQVQQVLVRSRCCWTPPAVLFHYSSWSHASFCQCRRSQIQGAA